MHRIIMRRRCQRSTKAQILRKARVMELFSPRPVNLVDKAANVKGENLMAFKDRQRIQSDLIRPVVSYF